MGSDFNSLKLGEFNPHRKGLTATDSSAPTNAKAGINGRGFQKVILDIKKNSGTFSGLTVELYFWSAAVGKFVPNVAARSVAFTAEGQAVLDIDGRIFFAMVTAISGASNNVDINVSGVASDDGQ